MGILEGIIFLITYAIGVITLFLEWICYRRRIEYLETILFTLSFFLLVLSLSISSFLGIRYFTDLEHISPEVAVSMVLLGLTTPLNIFVERKIKVPLPEFATALPFSPQQSNQPSGCSIERAALPITKRLHDLQTTLFYHGSKF